MKNGAYKKYICIGLTILSVVVLSIVFFFCLFKFESLFAGIQKIIDVLKPFIYGLGIAYLLLPVFNLFQRKLQPFFLQHTKDENRAKKLSKALSTTLSLLVAFLLVGALLSMILPELINSIMTLVESNVLQNSFQDFMVWLQDTLEKYPDIEEYALKLYREVFETLRIWITTEMLPQINSLMNSILGTFTFAKNLFIGIFITIYVLNSKEIFSAQAKKITYSVFSVPHANLMISNVRFVHHVFGGFINGKLLDSLIIGIICFVGMSLFKMPYSMLVSVIIGVTNIIPFFGPFIGAIPSAILIFMISPQQALYFAIFALALQQFDGNILGPKILGDSTGLSSFWVMFAILVFGGLFGFVGMILGVPIFAVLYSLIAGIVNHSLEKRHLPKNTAVYYNLDHIEYTDFSMHYGRTPSHAIHTQPETTESATEHDSEK